MDSLPAVERAWTTHWAERRGVDPASGAGLHSRKQAITSAPLAPYESEAEIQREFQLLEQVEAQDTDSVPRAAGRHRAAGAPERARHPLGDRHLRFGASGRRSPPGRRFQPAVFITAEQVKHGKPQPDAYLLGAERLTGAARVRGG